MNARLLTLLLLICSAALASFFVKPQIARAKAAHRVMQEAQGQHTAALRREEAVKQFPAGKLDLPTSDVAVTGILARWMRTRRDYGVALNDVQSLTSRSGQAEVPVSSLQTDNAATGLKVQTLSLKGQYESMEAFQRFVREQVLGHGASISSAKLQNNSFTLVVQVFGR